MITSIWFLPLQLTSITNVGENYQNILLGPPQLSSEATDVNITDHDGGTALHCAAQNGHVPVVESLLRRRGVDANKVKPGAGTPLHLATAGGKMLVADLLLAHDEATDPKTVDAMTTAPGPLMGVVSKILAGLPPPEASECEDDVNRSCGREEQGMVEVVGKLKQFQFGFGFGAFAMSIFVDLAETLFWPKWPF